VAYIKLDKVKLTKLPLCLAHKWQYYLVIREWHYGPWQIALLTKMTALIYITVQARNINQCAVQTRSLGRRCSCHDNTWLKLHQTGVATSASALTTCPTDTPDTKVHGITQYSEIQTKQVNFANITRTTTRNSITNWVTHETSSYILMTDTGSQSWWRLPMWSRNVDKLYVNLVVLEQFLYSFCVNLIKLFTEETQLSYHRIGLILKLVTPHTLLHFALNNSSKLA